MINDHIPSEYHPAMIALGFNVPEERDAILHWKAYLKRIKPVPFPVLEAAVTAFRSAQARVFISPGSTEADKQLMDAAGDLVWNALDDAARREWLLKAD